MALIRLQKYFTDCGVMSRRAAEEQIRLGKVRVNGNTAKIGDCVEAGVDVIEFNGKIIIPQCDEKICVMLNKPRGYVTTMSDEKGRKNVSMLVEDVGVRVYPVGRLDMDSEGLLLLTNDGELAEKLTHPKHDVPKLYHVTVRGQVTDSQLAALSREMVIDGYKIQPVKVKLAELAERDPRFSVLEMTLYEGRNRQIRKMCDAVSLKITRLKRVAIGSIKLGALAVGRWRRLSKAEIEYLKSPNTAKGNNKK